MQTFEKKNNFNVVKISYNIVIVNWTEYNWVNSVSNFDNYYNLQQKWIEKAVMVQVFSAKKFEKVVKV